MIDRSVTGLILDKLVFSVGAETAHKAVDLILAKFTVSELAAFAADWSQWGRQKQQPPPGDWISWGFLTGRRFGKTLAVSHFVNREIEAGRAPMVALMAQDESNSVALQVLGPSGLIATASPDFKPEWEASKLELRYPNGARAIVRTPEVPGKIRGFDYALSWLTEIQSWPIAHRVDAYDQVLISTSLGLRRIVWDCTPKRRHPVLLQLLANGARDPSKHVIVRGHMNENTSLGAEYLADQRRRFGNTSKGREEIEGQMVEDSDAALVKQAWIDATRRAKPEAFLRRVLSVDPAVTTRGGSDRTGLVDVGLGVDGQAYVLGDYTGKHTSPEWTKIILDTYAKNACCLVIVETNKGGDLVRDSLRAAASERGVKVVVVGKNETPRHTPNVVNLKEVHARGAKEDRAAPLATAYERGRVSHVLGVSLEELEDLLTTWEPAAGQRSPDALDALSHAVAEILGFGDDKPDLRGGFAGITKMLTGVPSGNLASLLSGGDRGGRI